MKRIKRHKIKKEAGETSTSHTKDAEEHDLAYYIHDRVELMHQVFSVLKHKEVRVMAPECVRNLSVDNLQELCTEELLGISSKRLCAILDGAEPPSDTESSSASSREHLETISLDSISSDEEILSQTSSKKKKHKHRRRDSKAKSKHKRKSTQENTETGEQNVASRAGLTVLELLELQARARAIRAQLQQEQRRLSSAEGKGQAQKAECLDTDDEVEIKEEPADVVEISSEDEKPRVEDLQRVVGNAAASSKDTEATENTQTVTKRINDLIITVPQSKPTRKIKLNRNNLKKTPPVENEPIVANVETPKTVTIEKETQKPKSKEKKKKKDKKRVESKDKDGSDHDEITLQLSDSEKMDLLEDLDKKNYDNVSSSSEDSESSSSSDDEADNKVAKHTSKRDSKTNNKEKESNKNIPKSPDKVKELSTKRDSPKTSTDKESSKNIEKPTNQNGIAAQNITENKTVEFEKETFDSEKQKEAADKISEEITTEKEDTSISEEVIATDKYISTSQKAQTNVDSEDSNKREDNEEKETKLDDQQIASPTNENQPLNINTEKTPSPDKNTDKCIEITSIEDIPVIIELPKRSEVIEREKRNSIKEQEEKNSAPQNKEEIKVDAKNQETESKVVSQETTKTERKSEGELSDRDSSEVEACDLKPEVVCISDDDKTHKKKKKKKEKKSKKKKSKSDFRESADQNFYKETTDISNLETTIDLDKIPNIDLITEQKTTNDTDIVETITIDVDKKPSIDLTETTATDNPKIIDENAEYISDDVYEILQLSDDSSCYEVEGVSVSKEPTAEEIEALSAKMDEIEREEVVTDEQIREHERLNAEKEMTENISWRDRYLDSIKVKRVLNTANILNAIRKKNKELKKKLEETKKEVEVEEKVEEPIKEINIEEGSIEHFNTLEASTKYVDPVTEDKKEETSEKENDEDSQVVKEMKKDAKQLLKMYKKLLKYNDMNKQSDPIKKKAKKKRKKEKKATVAATESSV